MPSGSAVSPDSPVTLLPGVGGERSFQLGRLKIQTVGDLLLHRPRRYEDRRHCSTIRELQLDTPATVRGRVVAQGTNYFRQRTKSVFEIILDDGTARLHCRWWNLPFMERYFSVGDDVMVYGRPLSLRPRTMDHPETERLEEGEEASLHLDRIVPIHPLTEGLPARWLRGLIWRALEQVGPRVPEPRPAMSAAIRATPPGLPDRATALRNLHFPAELPVAEIARQRLALDEFIELQLALRERRRRLEANAVARPCAGDNRLIRPFLKALGFTLTAAQTRVLGEIRADLRGRVPMRRLLQGDVGSGKTAVSAAAALMAIESGHDVALMVPTEILARQHHTTFTRWLSPLGVGIALQTGAQKLAATEPPAATPPAGPATGSLVIGTHALIQPAFAAGKLGLVIIDEQHKFGVAQREQLVRKGIYPHLLVMTATPIPRSLGLTLYGDLDSSVLDELPPGRGRIRTYVRAPSQLGRVLAFVAQQLVAGRQAYFVYPRVEEGDLRTGLKAVKAELANLTKALAPHAVALLHGRLAAAEKAAVMDDFRARRVQVLVATTVIEVGVDVPNATVMVIENAGQFGLAQLHQLRGRIGRGGHESYCILVDDQRTPGAAARLQVMAETTDGFRLAEADLEQRGVGELLGDQQSGLPPFRFGDLSRDGWLVSRARELAVQHPLTMRVSNRR